MARIQSISTIGTASIPAYRLQSRSGITHPADIVGMTGHFRASSIVGLNNGDAIATWKDDLGVDVVTQTGANRPTFQSAAADLLNGYPIARFDGTNHFMSGTQQNKVVRSTAAVIKSSESTFTQYRGILTGKVGDAAHDGLIADGTASSTSLYGATSSNYIDGSTVDADNLVTPTEWHIVIGIQNAPAKTYTTGIYIGQDRTTTTRRWKGDIAEIICYSTALSASERANIFAYLNDKYAVY